jgi:predicted RNase H-like nuclease (RuvC/YqgF family)
MICADCGEPISGFIEDHICKGERVGKIKYYDATKFRSINNYIDTIEDKLYPEIRTLESKLDKLEKENEQLQTKNRELQYVIDCLRNEAYDS